MRLNLQIKRSVSRRPTLQFARIAIINVKFENHHDDIRLAGETGHSSTRQGRNCREFYAFNFAMFRDLEACFANRCMLGMSKYFATTERIRMGTS